MYLFVKFSYLSCFMFNFDFCCKMESCICISSEKKEARLSFSGRKHNLILLGHNNLLDHDKILIYQNIYLILDPTLTNCSMLWMKLGEVNLPVYFLEIFRIWEYILKMQTIYLLTIWHQVLFPIAATLLLVSFILFNPLACYTRL